MQTACTSKPSDVSGSTSRDVLSGVPSFFGALLMGVATLWAFPFIIAFLAVMFQITLYDMATLLVARPLYWCAGIWETYMWPTGFLAIHGIELCVLFAAFLFMLPCLGLNAMSERFEKSITLRASAIFALVVGFPLTIGCILVLFASTLAKSGMVLRTVEAWMFGTIS